MYIRISFSLSDGAYYWNVQANNGKVGPVSDSHSFIICIPKKARYLKHFLLKFIIISDLALSSPISGNPAVSPVTLKWQKPANFGKSCSGGTPATFVYLNLASTRVFRQSTPSTLLAQLSSDATEYTLASDISNGNEMWCFLVLTCRHILLDGSIL